MALASGLLPQAHPQPHALRQAHAGEPGLALAGCWRAHRRPQAQVRAPGSRIGQPSG